jgi:serine/threonine-protein kinase
LRHVPAKSHGFFTTAWHSAGALAVGADCLVRLLVLAVALLEGQIRQVPTGLTVTDAMASRLADALHDRYTLERELGRGGTATVYLAHDLRHDRPVALKVLRPELAAALGPARFLREIRVTARLQHPHILTVLDSGETAERLWFTMPFVEGESLRGRLARERQLPIREALRITLDAAEALEYAHLHGVIHRDVKPENLLLTADRSTLVADFGLARSYTGEGEGLTEAGLALGTPVYMSPEQATGAELDERSDVYSLGCVLYEMVAGEPPFSAYSPAAMLARKLAEPAPSLRVVRDSLPKALEDVIMQALARVPADRFSTMREFAQALETAAGETFRDKRPVGERRKTRKPLVAGLVIAATLIVGITLWSWTSRDAGLVANRVAVGVFANRTGDSSLDALGSMAADWLTDGILRSGIAEVVPTTATLFVLWSSRSKRDSASPPDFRRLAEETGAATIVMGSYYRVRDSLRFEARLLHLGRDRVFPVISPVTGSADRPLQVIETLRQRVVGALAVKFDSAAESGGLGHLNYPPTYDAYKSYLEALRLFSQLRFADGIPRLDTALALDSTFTSALLLKAWAHASIGELTRFDSVVAVLENQRQRLSPAEGYELEWLTATRRGDLAAARRALRQQVALTPDPAARYAAAVFALRTNRPREAIGDLTRRDRESLYWRTIPWTWQVPTEAYHLLGNHSRELEEARHGRQQHGDLAVNLDFELLARAGLGQVKEVHSLLDQASQLVPQPIWTFGPMASVAALELRAHGRPDSAQRVMQRAIDWYRARRAENPEQTDITYGLARCLYWADEWSEARELLAGLIARLPPAGASWHGVGTASDFDYFGLLGTVAARQGDRAEALRMAERLSTMQRPNLFFGQPTLWRAKIAVLLGDRDGAVGLLREAISQGLMPLDLTQGLGYPMLLHRDTDFESLREYQPFLDIFRSTD